MTLCILTAIIYHFFALKILWTFFIILCLSLFSFWWYFNWINNYFLYWNLICVYKAFECNYHPASLNSKLLSNVWCKFEHSLGTFPGLRYVEELEKSWGKSSTLFNSRPSSPRMSNGWCCSSADIVNISSVIFCFKREWHVSHIINDSVCVRSNLHNSMLNACFVTVHSFYTNNINFFCYYS